MMPIAGTTNVPRLNRREDEGNGPGVSSPPTGSTPGPSAFVQHIAALTDKEREDIRLRYLISRAVGSKLDDMRATGCHDQVSNITAIRERGSW